MALLAFFVANFADYGNSLDYANFLVDIRS